MAVIPALALPNHDQAAVDVLNEPNVGARRIDMLHRRGRHEPSPAAELVAQAISAQTDQ